MSTGPNPEIGQRIVAAGAVANEQGSDHPARAQRSWRDALTSVVSATFWPTTSQASGWPQASLSFLPFSPKHQFRKEKSRGI